MKNRKQANAFEVQSLVMAAPSHSVKELDDCYYAELHKRCDRYDLGRFRDSQTVSEQTAAHIHLSDVYVDANFNRQRDTLNFDGQWARLTGRLKHTVRSLCQRHIPD